MKLTLENDHPMYINHYDLEKIVINHQAISHSVLVTSKEHQPWPVNSLASLTESDFTSLDNENVILLASTKGEYCIDHQLQCTLAKRGMGVEVMSISALCRTFNLLIQEGRCVAAGLIFSES